MEKENLGLAWIKSSKALVGKRRRAIADAAKLEAVFSGEEMAKLQMATSLNRRMLDRGPEHETLDWALSLVMNRLNEAFDKTPAGLELIEDAKILKEAFYEAYPEHRQPKKEQKP